uniref:Doublecortin domain-containing protein 2 n=1 Tax=Gasterosteus aculeatus aculeatus TaxID=481459 RepID=A0AAQ4S6A9_GASAC|nr:doublecortin domain-containing protein 2-like isoform X1 [Gasterosteus aculeatus aculeatus]
MSSAKPNFLSQPIVKNVFMYRNGDPYYDARRIVVNQKRVANFDTLLREVTGGIQAPFGAVRNIYTPRGGHKVDCLESLQSGEQYVAAGRERFKRLDYLQIGSRRKKMMQTPLQAKPLPPNRIIVSARFLKPIKEPCTIFVVSNGDVLNPAMRLLIHQRMLSQFERILELITEKMGLRVFGGVRSLYTYEGHQVSDGNQLECGQLYVAVGRERFKKLPYSDLLFTKPRGTRRVNGMKAYSLPPIYRFSKQNGNSKSTVRCVDSGDSESKAAPLSHTGSKDRLSSIVREISQARLLSIRKRSSGQSISNNEDLESKKDDGNTEDETCQHEPAEDVETHTTIPADDATKAAEENAEIAADKEEDVAVSIIEEEPSATKDENHENIGKKEEGEDKDENTEQNAERSGAATGSEEVEDEVEKQVQEVVANESKEEVKCEETGSSSSNSDKIQYSEEKDHGGHTSGEGEKDEQDRNTEEETQDKDSEKGEKSSEDQVNDEDSGNDQKETGNSSEMSHSNNETQENHGGRHQHEDVSKTEEGATKESEDAKKEVNGEVSGEDDEVLSGAELDNEGNSDQDAERNEEKLVDCDKDSQDKNRK